jgi:hypothetical protein
VYARPRAFVKIGAAAPLTPDGARANLVAVRRSGIRFAARKEQAGMKRVVMIAMVLGALVSCKKQHPVNVYVDPRFNDTDAPAEQQVEKIAVTRFASSLNHADDPDGVAPKTLERFFDEALATRTDYKLIARSTVEYAVEQNQWGEAYQRFLRSYASTDKPDMAFLGELARVLQCDAVLIPVVDLWQKDEVDITENSTPATYVGATITVVDVKDGSILFRSTDEDYLEGARSETADRSLVTSGSGAVYADLGKKVHRAPPFEDVAIKVAQALASSLPPR